MRLAGGSEVAYLDSVSPRPFLDDTTTKNVPIHEGALTGVVDVDSVCFGDPLFAVALTRMALLSRDFDIDYIDYQCAALNLPDVQWAALDLYTTLSCVGFLSEFGQAFSEQPSTTVDTGQTARLLSILHILVAALHSGVARRGGVVRLRSQQPIVAGDPQ